MVNTEKLIALRKEKDFTQEKLGFVCGVSHAMIAMIEAGTKIPSIFVLNKIATALGVSAKDLLL